MTNETVLATGSQFYQVTCGPCFPFVSLLVWFSIPVLVVWTVLTVSKWMISRKSQRNPTNIVAACLVLFGLSLVKANYDMLEVFGLPYGAFLSDMELLFLCVAQVLQGVFVSGVVEVICATVACLVARRLPEVSLYTVTPLLIILLDMVVSLPWLMWLVSVKR